MLSETKTGGWLLLAGIGICITGSAVCAVMATRQPKPTRLTAVKQEQDFGQVNQGARLQGHFELVNPTGKPLRLLGVSKNCSCADIKISQTRLSPGASAQFSVEWSIGKARGAYSTDLYVAYATETGKEDSLRLRLKADVTPDIGYSPNKVLFTSGSADTVEVRLTRNVPEILLRQAHCTHRAFSATLNPDTWNVKVTFDPDLWPGDETLVDLCVTTTSNNEPIATIPIAIVQQ